jgi:hypothetical protein
MGGVLSPSHTRMPSLARTHPLSPVHPLILSHTHTPPPSPPFQVHYVERVNAELHELLERYESEFFQHQLQLEADRQAEASHAKLLQEDVVKLQERIAALMVAGGRDTDMMTDQDGKRMRGEGAGGREEERKGGGAVG